MLRANMRQEMVTTDELASELRKQGFNDYARIQKAFWKRTAASASLQQIRVIEYRGPTSKTLRYSQT